MRGLHVCLLSFCVLAGVTPSYADAPVLDCGKKSLAQAVRSLSDKNQTITFTGVCAGPIVIAIDGLTLKGVGPATIDGGGADAITITGSSRVSLVDLEVTNGLSGIVVRDGSHVALSGVNLHDNSESGMVFQAASTGVLSGITASHNGRGLVADDGAGITIGSSTLTGNTVKDIQLTFGSRADLQTVVLGTYTCDATVLVRGTAGIVCPH